MPGFSITLLLLPEHSTRSSPSAETLLSLLDEQPDVPGWRYAPGVVPFALDKQIHTIHKDVSQGVGQKGLPSSDPDGFINSIKAAAGALIDAEPEITKMDTIAGDGDCGLTLKVIHSL